MSLRIFVAHSEKRHASGRDVGAGPHFPELVETAIAGQEVVITRRRKPLVPLLPLAQQVSTRRLGTLAGKIRIADDLAALPFSDTSGVVNAEVESLTKDSRRW